MKLPPKFHERFSIVQRILDQKTRLFAWQKVSDRIISVTKHYIRPIVRRKETRSVEFGAKINNT